MELPSGFETEVIYDPLDMVETILSEEELAYERTHDGDICFTIKGGWKAYDMWFTWHIQGECLQLCCTLGAQGLDSLSTERRLALYELLGLINQRVWFGHFELYQDMIEVIPVDKLKPNVNGPLNADVVFRHALAVNHLEQPSQIQMAQMINRAAEAVDSFYPAFEFWFKGEMTPQLALDACLFETVGEA
jgi:hypothetical protein